MNRRESGFTIIETLIVLAVAGVILLIVFLAIPNLQRNGRNNQRNQDAQIVLQAVSNYELNHAGNFPGAAALRTFIDDRGDKGKLTFYDLNNIQSQPNSSTSAAVTYSAPTNIDQIYVINHAKCSSPSDASNAGAGYSDIVALYLIERANGTLSHCQQL